MDRLLAKKIIDSFNGNVESLYDKINYIDMESNNFNIDDYYELLFKTMFLYHLINGIESVSMRTQLPFVIDRNISYNEFRRQLIKYKEYELKIDLLPNIKNYFDNIIRLASSKLLGMSDWRWTRVYSSKVTGKENNNCVGKIFISVDNKDLYRFANLLLAKCLENGLTDYEFKINNDDSKTRRDNVVIYFTLENFSNYITIINRIIEENPDIKINSSHPFGYEVNDYIRVGLDYNNGNESFTERICNIICGLKKKGISTEEIIDYLDKMIKDDLSYIIGTNDLEKRIGL